MKALQLQWKAVVQYLTAQWHKFSRREHAMIAGAALVLVFTLCYLVYEPIQDAFDAQAVALAEAQGRTRTIGGTLEGYLKLKARRDLIESRYREVEFKEGALSHIENLIRTKALVTSGYTIKDNTPRPFGGSYEQVPYSVRFQISSLSALLDFLKEVVHGPRPLILSRLELQKSRIGDRLDVDLDVSSLRKI